MLENFEAKFMQSPPQQDEKNPENPSVQVENSENIELSSETASKSGTRIEERPFWAELPGAEVDKSGEYREPTPEQKEKFKKRIERLSEIFENADFQWYLDSGANISLYGDRQIRDHKDLDISVFEEDLAKLEILLERQGFGIFVNYYDKNGRKLMRRATAKELTALEKPYLSICKIDSDGKIDKKTKEPFNFVDLHIYKKDAEGNVIFSYNGITLPKEFFKPIKKKLSNGKQINLSQPAIIAYHKLHFNHPHNLIDLQKLKPYLQERDFRMLKESLKREIEEIEKRTREKMQEVWNYLMPTLKLTRDQKVISEKLLEYPLIKKRKSEQKVSEFIFSISQYISENPNITLEDFLNQSLVILKPREQFEEKIKIIDQLEHS